MFGDERCADPAIADLAGKAEALRGERGEVDRDRGDEGRRSAQSLALAAQQRKLVDLALVAEVLTPLDNAEDVGDLTDALEGVGEGNAVPAFDDLGATGTEAEDESVAGHVGEGHRRHGEERRSTGNGLHDAAAEADAGRLRGEVGEWSGRIVRPVFGGQTLSTPRRSASRTRDDISSQSFVTTPIAMDTFTANPSVTRGVGAYMRLRWSHAEVRRARPDRFASRRGGGCCRRRACSRTDRSGRARAGWRSG